VARQLYMTEDEPDGGLYRFTPAAYPDLGAGRLDVMVADGWAEVPDPAGLFTATRKQVPGMRQFDGGEGIWFDSGTVYFSTKGDNTVWAYDTATGALDTIYEGGGPLTGVDNLTVSAAGEIFVCEDGGNMEICVIEPGGAVAPFLRLTGEAATGLPDRGNELAGVVFDPSGRRLYFAAQRAYGFGVVYEVTGPFRQSGAVGSPRAARVAPAGGAPEVRAPRRVSFAALRRGLPVDVWLDEPGELRVALRTDALRTVPGRRGSTERPETVTLDRRRLAGARAGRNRVRLRVSAAEARRLRRARPASLRVAVAARLESGVTQVATLRVRLR
jgi:hypothetical protein